MLPSYALHIHAKTLPLRRHPRLLGRTSLLPDPIHDFPLKFGVPASPLSKARLGEFEVKVR